MCTVVVSFKPGDRMPLLLLGSRDEFTGRPWQRPARHWPAWPLVGGRDEEAGGTWLAVHPQVPRVSCVLNARGELAPLTGRRSRGELPLRAAAEGQQAVRALYKHPDDLAGYDPFFLVCADLSSVLMLSWDGTDAALDGLAPGTHLLTNAGRLYPRDEAAPPTAPPGPAPPSGMPDPAAKAARFGPKFAAQRPSGDPAATITDAWGEWLALAEGDGLPDTDPAALIVRRELPDGRVWGTTSVSLVSLGPGGLRYDFQPVPGDLASWYPVRCG